MESKKIKIALVAYTQGLDYDDRIRKEVLSVQKLFPNISFKLFALQFNNAEHREGITSYGVPYEILHLKSRDKYGLNGHAIKKAIDLFFTVRKSIKDYNYLWFADTQTCLNVLFSSKPTIWDLHELPLMFMNNRIGRVVFNIIARKCRVIVHANKERIDYLEKVGMCKNREKHLFLRNYPSFAEKPDENDTDFKAFKQWLGGRKCVYLQGLSDHSRADYESVAAVLKKENLCGVVVGGFMTETKQRLKEEFGQEFEKRIYFTGMVKQLQTPLYIQSCKFAIVMYKKTSPNNWYCEPNRLFQNVVNGKPVITGANPPMKEFVENYQLGIVIQGDGSDVDQISSAIGEMMENYEQYKDNVDKHKDLINWESQEETFKEIIEKLI